VKLDFRDKITVSALHSCALIAKRALLRARLKFGTAFLAQCFWHTTSLKVIA